MDRRLLRRNLLSYDDADDKDLKKLCDLCLYKPSDSCPSDCPDSPAKSHHKLSALVSAIVAVVSFTFLLVLCYAVYVRFYSRRRTRRPPPPPPAHHQEFLDEEQGPVLDHPIWYIRTVGLPAAVVASIAVCTFKSGDGLIDGTECSVCLSEFSDGESLRLLPKCSHAFHLPCIDTWLRSHTTCPLCRAPIVTRSAAAPDETQMGDLPDSGEVRTEEGNSGDLGADSARDEVNLDEDLRLGDDDEDSEQRVSDFQGVRRSVSLDSVAALGISSVLGGVHRKVDSEEGAAMNRSVSCSGKFLMRSSTQRSSEANHN